MSGPGKSDRAPPGSGSMDYDLIVVGGGAGGMAAARAGVRARRRTVLIQDGEIGGDCTFTGCVPSKTFIEAAARGVAFEQAIEGVRAAVARIAATESAEVFRREGIDVLEGRARFTGPRRIEVAGRQLGSQRLVLATGSRPAIPRITGLDQLDYLTNESVFDLQRLPGSVAVLGGGPVGCELAQALRRFGARVTVVEALDRLLSKEEPAASQVIAEVFDRDGIDVRCGQAVEQVASSRSDGAAELTLSGGRSLRADRVLVAVGRTPVTEGLNLEVAGVAVDERGHVRTDRYLATTAAGVYAVGDVTGRLPFTHAADEMGRIAVANAFRRAGRTAFRADWTPWVTFTDPEVARVGLREAEAVPAGGRVAVLPLSELDRAITAGRTDGFVQLLAGPRPLLRGLGGGQVLGATIVAPRAGEMIQEVALAMRTRMFTGRLAQTAHPYPSWSVGVQQAAAQFFFEIDGRRASPARR